MYILHVHVQVYRFVHVKQGNQRCKVGMVKANKIHKQDKDG